MKFCKSDIFSWKMVRKIMCHFAYYGACENIMYACAFLCNQYHTKTTTATAIRQTSLSFIMIMNSSLEEENTWNNSTLLTSLEIYYLSCFCQKFCIFFDREIVFGLHTFL